jgi:hypothetical protein
VQETTYSSIVNTGFLVDAPEERGSGRQRVGCLGISAQSKSGKRHSDRAAWPAAFPLVPTLYGTVAYQFAKHWTGRARWDYYDYHEDSNGSYQDLYAPRNFHANLITLSVRYSF